MSTDSEHATTSPHARTIIEFGRNPALAHAVLFQHRHPQETPDFHHEVINLWHSNAPRVEIMAFRGGGKSTTAEEGVIVESCLQQFHNGIIIGSSYERAVERLTAIKHELETNPFIEELFGVMRGNVWNEGKIVLSNGVVLQAFGRGQSMRGSKHLTWRPDRVFADDLEEQEDVDTPEARAKMLRWFMKVVLPALDPSARIRIAATPLHPESLAMVLKGARDWVCKTYPIESIAKDGGRMATWPSRFSLTAIDEIRKSYEDLGMLDEYQQEYMCQAEDEKARTFTADMIRIDNVVRTWQGVYAMYDPARTVNSKSATTGWAVWSWIGNKLVIWDGGAHKWMPNEIIDHIFWLNAEYEPIEIYVELNGLEEFIMQPLRQEQLKRQTLVPIRGERAPKNKISFIKALQPFFKAKEIVFAKDLPEMKKQLLGFPTGMIDAPNALAYAPRLRPGLPVFDNFSMGNVIDGLNAAQGYPVWLVVNATSAYTAGVLVQSIDGGINVLADYVREGNPGQVLESVVASAGLDAGRSLRLVAPPNHFTGHDTVGLRPAAGKIPVELRPSGDLFTGQAEIQRLLKTQIRQLPAIKVSSTAKWTLNAFSGGYCREIQPNGQPSQFTKQGPHKVLMEGLEGFAGLLRVGFSDDDTERHYAINANGRRYLSALR